jgi:hypothetical protein
MPWAKNTDSVCLRSTSLEFALLPSFASSYTIRMDVKHQRNREGTVGARPVQEAILLLKVYLYADIARSL